MAHTGVKGLILARDKQASKTHAQCKTWKTRSAKEGCTKHPSESCMIGVLCSYSFFAEIRDYVHTIK